MALIALIAVLIGLPAMTLVSDSRSGGTAGTVAPSGRASVMVVGLNPVTVTGRGFKPRELVRVTVEGKRESVTAGPRGGFKVRFPGADSCNGFVVVARGSEGSRASVAFAQFSNVHCLEPGATTQSAARKPTLRLVGYEPLIVRGDAFRPGERVRLFALGSLKHLNRTTTASASGAFKASFKLGSDRCSPLVVAAVGSLGSRASARVQHRPCKPPRVPPPRQ
jgi:hypothetical protein